MSDSILTEEDRKLLIRVNRLLEEVLEALEVMGDNGTVKAIREGEEDVKAGRVKREEAEEALKKLSELV